MTRKIYVVAHKHAQVAHFAAQNQMSINHFVYVNEPYHILGVRESIVIILDGAHQNRYYGEIYDVLIRLNKTGAVKILYLADDNNLIYALSKLIFECHRATMQHGTDVP